MSSNNNVSKSRRRLLEAALAGAVAVGAGLVGYELGVKTIRCPPCPKCPQTPANATTTTTNITTPTSTPISGVSCNCPPCPAQSIPQGFDYIVFTSNGNYYVMDSSGQTIYQSSDPGSVISYAINQLGGKGGRILIKSGVYTCNSFPCITISNTTSSGSPSPLVVEGEEGTVITVGNGVVSSSSSGGLVQIGGSNIIITNIAIDGNSQNNNYGNDTYNLLINGDSIWVFNVSALNGGGIGVINSSNVVIMDSISDDNAYDGVYIGGSKDVFLVNSEVVGNANYGIEISNSSNVTINGSLIRDNTSGINNQNSNVSLVNSVVEFVSITGNYGINANIGNTSFIISGVSVRGSMKNAINVSLSNGAELTIVGSSVTGGSSETLSISSTLGSGAKIVIMATQFKDANTTPNSYSYVISGVDSVELVNNSFTYGNAASSVNGIDTANSGYVIIRGNEVSGYNVCLSINNCNYVELINNYFMNTTTPVMYTNVTQIITKSNAGYTPTVITPAIPSSESSIVNTYPVSVMVFMYGGSVTQITVTKAGQQYVIFQSTTPQSLNGEYVILNPGDSITINYVQPPNWVWVPNY
ncbi:MAG: right-handed parallel beta-helix repeat-containing protein [Vulcanisaeta sp.]|uniref:right-handed parallel beta-helix repeat-containing protein n=1 Tax=Vulcanisaeta sp. TaxID=2020871 RepID=UPI003D0A4E94